MGSATLELLEDILVYGILLGLLVFLYFNYFTRETEEGFAVKLDVRTVQARIDADLSSVRSKSPTFFTQKSSAPTLPPNQSFLVNICPLTAYLGGYLGPPEEMMDEVYYLQNAFKAGIRSFVLPITTYINVAKVPDNGWPYSGEPVLLARDPSDVVISKNGITIEAFLKALLQFKSVSGYIDEPIFLFLEDNVLDIDKKKINYVTFMNKIASSLNIIDPYRLTTVGSYGSVTGGKQQNKLLTEIPLSHMKGKIIIFTNFDTAQDDSKTLASYANFIYTKGSKGPKDPTLSVQTLALENLPGSTVDYVSATRINWHIAKSSTPLTPPTLETVNIALAAGIQCIPIPFMSTPMASVKEIWSLWNGASYILKPEGARYTQPDPVVPAQVSQRLNASIQGQEPGQVVVNN